MHAHMQTRPYIAERGRVIFWGGTLLDLVCSTCSGRWRGDVMGGGVVHEQTRHVVPFHGERDERDTHKDRNWLIWVAVELKPHLVAMAFQVTVTVLD